MMVAAASVFQREIWVITSLQSAETLQFVPESGSDMRSPLILTNRANIHFMLCTRDPHIRLLLRQTRHHSKPFQCSIQTQTFQFLPNSFFILDSLHMHTWIRMRAVHSNGGLRLPRTIGFY